MILGILDQLQLGKVPPDSADYVHLIVEATKQAFRVRDKHITDPAFMTVEAQDLLDAKAVAALAAAIQRDRALPWDVDAQRGDTVWTGAIDAAGRAVSFIQSIYHEFGSGWFLAVRSVAGFFFATITCDSAHTKQPMCVTKTVCGCDCEIVHFHARERSRVLRRFHDFSPHPRLIFNIASNLSRRTYENPCCISDRR